MTEITIDVKEATVLLTSSTDLITLELNGCENPFHDMIGMGTYLDLECARNTGEKYMIDNFGITPRIINSRVEGV